MHVPWASDRTAKKPGAQTRTTAILSTCLGTERHPVKSERPTGHPKGHFEYRHGQRRHSFVDEKAPYPLSYDRDVLEIEALDNEFIHSLKGSVSFVNFEKQPSRVLDLGCGMGTWIIQASKEWPSCTFVGLDLVNVQIPTTLLDSGIRNRVEWRHGNFLTTRLPFEEDEFDHVHIQFVAKGVPEHKWNYLFGEVNRVLCPGGSVEVIEEDFVFPVLPKWFTEALHTCRESSVHLPSGHLPLTPAISPRKTQLHDHALLESLMGSVFEGRFINFKPTAILPGYFTSYFRQIAIGPVIQFSMPGITPLQPLPAQTFTDYALSDLDPPPMTESFTPDPRQRPSMLPSSSATVDSATPGLTSVNPSSIGAHQGLKSMLSTSVHRSARDSVCQTSDAQKSLVCNAALSKKFLIDDMTYENDKTRRSPSLIPFDHLDALTERSLAMQLYKSYQTVLACREAMWDELKFRLHNGNKELIDFGWDNDEELKELQARKKFEKLMGRFQNDMRTRLAFWSSLTECGFKLPPREPLSKAEYTEEVHRRAYLVETYKQVTTEEVQETCRTLRVLVGHKCRS